MARREELTEEQRAFIAPLILTPPHLSSVAQARPNQQQPGVGGQRRAARDVLMADSKGRSIPTKWCDVKSEW